MPRDVHRLGGVLKKPQYSKKPQVKRRYQTPGRIVEGRTGTPQMYIDPRATRSPGKSAMFQRTREEQQQYADFTNRVIYNREEKQKYKDTQSVWAAEDKARAKIRPIIDPDANVATRRRKAARRKTQGRMGTILSQGQGTQRLGSKGTLG